MLTEYAASHPINVGAVPWPDGRSTIIVKLTFSLSGTGTFQFIAQQDPLSLDVTDAKGELLYPSDFAPYKPSCDVCVVGEAVLDRAMPGRLSVGPIVKTAEALETLGPRETFCPLGDPTDTSVVGLWTKGKIDFARFQAAPPSRRMPWPTQGFPIEYLRGAHLLSSRFEGPIAHACMLSVDSAQIVAGLALCLDTILIDPVKMRGSIVFRGVHTPSSPAPVRCVVDLSPIPVHDARFMASWQTSPLATPESLRDLEEPLPGGDTVALPADRTKYLSGYVESAALPFSKGGTDRPRPLEESTSPSMKAPDKPFGDFTAPALKAPPPELPFERPAPTSSAQPLSQKEFEQLRSVSAEPVAPAWEAGGQTMFGGRSPAARSDPGSVKDPAPVEDEDTPSARDPAPKPPPSGFRLQYSPQPIEPPAEPALLSDEKFAEIQQALWKGEEPFADVLAGFGISETEWRANQRARKGPSPR